MLQEAQSIWQISVLIDGAPSDQQSICFILIPSNVYSRIWTQDAFAPQAPAVVVKYLHPPVTLFLSHSLTVRATLSPNARESDGICSPSSSRAAKSSNQTRHPSLSLWGGVNDLDAVFTLNFRYPWAPLWVDLSSECAAGLHI